MGTGGAGRWLKAIFSAPVLLLFMGQVQLVCTTVLSGHSPDSFFSFHVSTHSHVVAAKADGMWWSLFCVHSLLCWIIFVFENTIFTFFLISQGGFLVCLSLGFYENLPADELAESSTICLLGI